jgi:hypothetical protein
MRNAHLRSSSVPSTAAGSGTPQCAVIRPDRTDLTSRLIANSKDKIHDRRTGTGEFLPTFASQTRYRQVKPIKQVNREWMHCAFRETACAVSLELPIAQMVQQDFGKNAARRVPCTQEQDVIDLRIHGRFIDDSMVSALR